MQRLWVGMWCYSECPSSNLAGLLVKSIARKRNLLPSWNLEGRHCVTTVRADCAYPARRMEL